VIEFYLVTEQQGVFACTENNNAGTLAGVIYFAFSSTAFSLKILKTLTVHSVLKLPVLVEPLWY
jgi:hypothetical protein